MARPFQFPITIKAGGTAIKIYHTPLHVKVVPPLGTQTEPGQKPQVVSYDSYTVVHYRGGKRERQRFTSLALAQTEAARLRALLLNEDAVGLQLTGEDILEFSQASHKARELGLSLSLLTNEFAAAKKMLGAVNILQAAHFYQRYGQTVKEQKLVPEVVEELLAGLKADHKSAYHQHDMEHRLRNFAQQFPGFIMAVETKAISEWLRHLKGRERDGQEFAFAPKTRNHYRNAVIQLFNHARDHGYLPKGMPTEAEGVKSLTVVPTQNEIFTPEQMLKLLSHAPTWLVPALAIKAFSGVRTEEILRMTWGALNFETKHITLAAEVTKTKQRRLVPIPDNLVAWLQPYRGKTGRVCERWGRPQAFVQAFDRVSKKLGIASGANRFRNSYITYRVAVTHDIQRVALESGNSPRVIQREYLELATEADGKRWFAICPPAAPPKATGVSQPAKAAKIKVRATAKQA